MPIATQAKHRYSIRNRLLIGLLVFLVPLVSLLLIYNFITVDTLRDKTAQSNQNTLSIYSEIVESRMSAADNILIDVSVNNPWYYTARTSSEELDIYLASYGIVNSLQTKIVQSDYVDIYFAMIKGRNREVYNNKSLNDFSQDERNDFHADLIAMVAEQPSFFNQSWHWTELGGRKFLMRIIGNQGVYIGALIDLDNLIYPLAKSTLFDDYKMVYSTVDGAPLTNAEFVEEKKIDLARTGGNYYLSGSRERYLVLSTDLSKTDVRMIALIPDPTYLAGLSVVQVFLFILSLLTIFVIPFMILFLRRSFVSPLNRLVETMTKIQGGNMSARVEDEFVAEEFSQANDTFNAMISEVQSLKISAYEQQLARQKAELQYLQFQIKPHFFLNSLKVLYGLAERAQTSMIQDIVLALSNHFRYMFKDNFTTVTLRDELAYVKNYIHIQQLFKSYTYRCLIDVEENLMDLQILPLTVQTFVENAIKHGVRPDTMLEIQIKARLLHTEDGDYAAISVSDNGSGFSREMLEKLNFADPLEVDESHIGLSNVRQRLAIKYAGLAHLAFANGSAGGAKIEMLLPVGPRTVQEGGSQ